MSNIYFLQVFPALDLYDNYLSFLMRVGLDLLRSILYIPTALHSLAFLQIN